MSIYSLVSPLMMFIIVLVQMSLPIALSKLVAKDKLNRKNYLLSAYIISLSISLFIMILLIIFSKDIAINIFKNKNTTHSIMAIGIYAPFVTITSLYKGYLIGNEKIEVTSFSQITEEIGRLIFIYLTCNYFKSHNLDYSSMGIIVGMWIGEIFQMLSLIISNYGKNLKIKKIIKEINHTKINSYKKLFEIALPITLSRLITSFSFSLEPIIYTNISHNMGYNNEYIANTYGIIQTYVNPILFLPSFFISSISLILLPNLSKLFHQNNIKKSKDLFIKSLYISLLIGLISSSFIFIFSKEIEKILFSSLLGNNYIKMLAFPYLLYYIESILNTTLHAINKEKISLTITIISSLIRVIFLFILIPFIGVIGIEIAMLISVLLVIMVDSFFIRKYLFLNI